MELDPQMLAEIQKSILPKIGATVDSVLRSHTAAADPDGENYSDNWCIGCLCWRNLFNRLRAQLPEDPFFNVQVKRNVMEISCANGSDNFVFYVYRVEEIPRNPTGAKSVKEYLQQQLWLSDEIETTIVDNVKGVNIIGYDLSIESGLGKVTLDRLCAVGKNKFEAVTLYDFGVSGANTDFAPQMDNGPVNVKPEENIKATVNKSSSRDVKKEAN